MVKLAVIVKPVAAVKPTAVVKPDAAVKLAGRGGRQNLLASSAGLLRGSEVKRALIRALTLAPILILTHTLISILILLLLLPRPPPIILNESTTCWRRRPGCGVGARRAAACRSAHHRRGEPHGAATLTPWPSATAFDVGASTDTTASAQTTREASRVFTPPSSHDACVDGHRDDAQSAAST